jgi:cell division septation protein DedD
MTTELALAVETLPFLTRAQALEEGERNPGFWSYLGRLMQSSDPALAVDNEMKKAAIDALDPGKYPEAGSRWPMLQAKLREVRLRIAEHLRDHGSMNGFFALSAYTIDPATGVMKETPDAPAAPAAKPADDIWSTIGKVFSTVGTAAASIYSSRITTSAGKSIANTQAQTLTAQQQAQQTQAAAVAQQQLQQAQKTGGTSGASIILYVLLGLVGIGGLMFLMKSMK